MNNKPFTILFVCSGNACRSPMAEGLLKKKLFPYYQKQVVIKSAGTLGLNGNPATPNTITVAKEKGVDISSHLSQGISANLIQKADIIFTMAAHHKETLLEIFPEKKDDVFLLTAFGVEEKTNNAKDIRDPIGENLTFYRQIIHQIDRELERILPELKKRIENK